MYKYLCIKTSPELPLIPGLLFTGTIGPFLLNNSDITGLGGDCIEGNLYHGVIYQEQSMDMIIDFSLLPDEYMFISRIDNIGPYKGLIRLMGIYPKENFLSVQEYRDELINKILEND